MRSQNQPTYRLSEEAAFRAMVKFLERAYDSSKSDAIGSLLGDLYLMADGKPIDPAAWTDWIECVERVVADERSG